MSGMTMGVIIMAVITVIAGIVAFFTGKGNDDDVNKK